MTSVGQRHTKLTFGGAKLAAFFGRGQTKKFEFDEFVMAGYRSWWLWCLLSRLQEAGDEEDDEKQSKKKKRNKMRTEPVLSRSLSFLSTRFHKMVQVKEREREER